MPTVLSDNMAAAEARDIVWRQSQQDCTHSITILRVRWLGGVVGTRAREREPVCGTRLSKSNTVVSTRYARTDHETCSGVGSEVRRQQRAGE